MKDHPERLDELRPIVTLDKLTSINQFRLGDGSIYSVPKERGKQSVVTVAAAIYDAAHPNQSKKDVIPISSDSDSSSPTVKKSSPKEKSSFTLRMIEEGRISKEQVDALDKLYPKGWGLVASEHYLKTLQQNIPGDDVKAVRKEGGNVESFCVALPKQIGERQLLIFVGQKEMPADQQTAIRSAVKNG